MQSLPLIMRTVLLLGIALNPAKPIVEKWVIERNSSMSIEGKSNVNTFCCDVVEYLRPDTILFFKDDAYKQRFTIKGGPTINIYHFDCHQQNITGDMRKTLKADAGSSIKIDLLTIGSFMPATILQRIKGTVAIELSGVTRTMEIDFTVQTDEKGYLHLCGKKDVLFSDFGLVPPRKLAGLIKVAQEINVRFQLVLRPV